MSSIDINATIIIFTDESSSSCRLYLGGTPNIYGRRECVWHGQCPVSWTTPNNVHTWFSRFCPEFMWDISISVRGGWHVRVREAKDRCSDSTKSRKVTPSHLFALPPRQIHPPPFLLSISLESSCLFLFTELLRPLCLCWREKKCVEMEEFITLSNFPSGQTRFWFKKLLILDTFFNLHPSFSPFIRPTLPKFWTSISSSPITLKTLIHH